jgi:hypothetical protein
MSGRLFFCNFEKRYYGSNVGRFGLSSGVISEQ